MKRPPLEIQELRDPDSEYARQAFEIYEASFPVEERDPVEHIAAGLRRAMGADRREDQVEHFWIALDQGTVNGLAMFTYFRDRRLGYVSYMAVRAGLRNQGLGSFLFQRLVEQIPRDAADLGGLPPVGLCFEVERPQDAPDDKERELRQRRIRFYQRNGAQLIDAVDFIAPPLDVGLPPVPFYLMFRPAETAQDPQPRTLYRSIVVTILVYGYGLPPEHPYVQRALASIPSSLDKLAT